MSRCRAMTSATTPTASCAPLPHIAPNCVGETMCAASRSASSVVTRAKDMLTWPIKLAVL
eukprot:2959613-Pyramimonas_sp.AAC.1